MFLFLSKLLPLFIYPLGLVCLLLVLGLWMSFKRAKKAYLPILLALVILLVGGNSQIGYRAIASLEHKYPPLETVPQAEAIVILGGATRNHESPRVLPDMSDRGDRLLYGAKLFKDGIAPQIILTGGRIKWFGGDLSEAENMAAIMELMGIPRSAMILESRALNTYENAIYTKEILEQKEIEKIVLVTSAAHMPRSLAIFTKAGISAIPASADIMISDRNLIENRQSLESRLLNLIPKSNSLDYTTQALKEYIGFLIYRLRGWL